ncbi:hypothetical protein PoB_002944200 [Plakobranchus ocellatus]|uniref:Uncharacterized protein n=1 Tax=Plakobranchus ocellatus TaxID=259542 RepID=A0AAV4A7V0_9GAST|nr:hypothetical protein PoB_002944200 [Plakobranchus ocellatus]
MLACLLFVPLCTGCNSPGCPDACYDNQQFQITRQKYLLLRSSDQLDVHFFLWNNDLTVLCSTLVLGVMNYTHVGNFMFLGHPGLDESSLALISAEETGANLNVFLPSNGGDLNLLYKKFHAGSRSTLMISETLTGQYQTVYITNITGMGKVPLIRSNTSLFVFSYTREIGLVFLCKASPQQGDLRLSGPPSGQSAGGGAQTRDRRIPADIRAGSPATVPPTPPTLIRTDKLIKALRN